MTLSYNIPVKNRFCVLTPDKMAANSENRSSGGNVDREVFLSSTVDDKLVAIFDELLFIRNEQVDCSRGMLNLRKSVENVSEKLGQVVDVTNQQSDFLRQIAYKSIDTEARSRRNNLIFRGFTEHSGENCYQIILEFLANQFDLDRRHVTSQGHIDLGSVGLASSLIKDRL